MREEFLAQILPVNATEGISPLVGFLIKSGASFMQHFQLQTQHAKLKKRKHKHTRLTFSFELALESKLLPL
jgi:hypothetical protein